MKIYEIGTGYTPIPAKTGAATEIVVEELTRAFLSKKEKVEILDISTKQRANHNLPISEIKIPAFFSKSDVRLGLVHKLKRVVYSVFLALTLRKLLKKEAEHIVLHFHNQYNLFFFYMLVPEHLQKKATIAYTVHSHIWHNPWETIQSTVAKKYFQESYCVKRANHVFVLNKQTEEKLYQHLHVSKDRIHLIDNGVNPNVYYPLSPEQINHVKEKFRVPGKKVLIQIGSVCDRKNQLLSVQMLHPLMQKNDQIVFCYAGGIISDEYQSSIQQFASDHGISDRVIYLGELKPGAELNEIYNMAEAMIFPSKAEGFSLVILEAMSAGIPVIIHENLQFKLSECCMKYNTPDSFSNLLYTSILCKGKNEDAISKMRLPIMNNYSWNSIAKQYLEIWNK